MEVFRDGNLPAQAAFNSFASSLLLDNSLLGIAIDPDVLRDGRNVLAVEVHQASATSSDISFDLQLTAVVVPEPSTLTLAALGLLGLGLGRRRRPCCLRG